MPELIKRYGLPIFLIVLSVIVVFVSLRDWSKGSEFRDGAINSRINNYVIFTTAFEQLIEKGDLYTVHPEKHFDIYKYSPTFAFFMAPFYYAPVWLGLPIWNLLNVLILYLGLRMLPELDRKKVLIVLFILGMELVGSVMNEQSNGLMAGLIVLSIALMERQKVFWAMALLVGSVYIKLFSLVFLSMLFFYPNFIRNSLIVVFWILFYAFIPALVTGWEQLMALYKSWGYLLAFDHSSSVGYSVLGILDSWFNAHPDKFYLVFAGLVLSMTPLLKAKNFMRREFRYDFMSMLLIWVIIFNHKAESPAFVIAMTGIGIWYVTGERTRLKNYLLIFAIFFISIGFSDLMPKLVREAFFYRYSLKALPGIVIWGWLVYRLMTADYKDQNDVLVVE